MKDTSENRKLVKRSFLKGIRKRGLSAWLDEMVAHWLAWEETKKIRKVALKCVRLHSMTGKGLPCVTSKSGVQCSDIFGAVLELKQALKGG